MNNYYSKNKRDHSSELAKIEQKRYEDILIQERNSRKLMINSIRSSVDEKKLGKPISNDMKILSNGEDIQSKNSLINEIKEQKPLEEKNINPIKRSSSLMYHDSKKSNQGESSIPELPKLPKLPKTGKSKNIKRKNQEREENEKLKYDLQLLEEEEAFIEASIQRLDLQAYKKKVSSNLQTISEETKEMEESLAKGLKIPDNSCNPPKDTGKNQEDLDVIPEIPNQSSTPDIKVKESIGKISIISRNADFPSKKTEKKSSVKNNSESPDTPSFKSKKNYKIPVRSIYSDKARKTRDQYGSNINTSDKSQKSRMLSKDCVRVNPNINIRELLYS